MELNKFRIQDIGYTLKSGTIATPDNVDNLSGADTIDLCQQYSSARDSLLIRRNIHDLINAMSAFMGNVELEIGEIKKSLICTVHNGDDHEEPLAVVVAKLADQHKHLRKRERLLKSLKENSIPIMVILFFAVLATAVVLKNDWIISAVLPIIWGLIKLFLSKQS